MKKDHGNVVEPQGEMPVGTGGPRPQTSFAMVAIIYLVGLMLGGLYVGIVAPMRTVIQTDLGIDSNMGIWIINIYTLFYASTILLSGNLADRYGRKRVFCVCLALFTMGSLVCGISQMVGGFGLLLAGRVVQALGAGGVIPVATTAMGVNAPEGKRGMWLGIASAVAGVSNTIGSAVGSVIAGLVGVNNWCWAFYLAVPLGLVLAVVAFRLLPDSDKQAKGRLDVAGAVVLTLLVLFVLLGIKGIQLDAPLQSLLSWEVYVPLLLACALIPLFRLVERKADDPVFHLEYLNNGRIVIIMATSFFVGCSIISMTLVPEYAEQVLNAPVGSGGYYMATIGVFAIVGPPVGGKLIDRFGPKPIMSVGLAVTAVGYVFMAVFVTYNPSLPVMILSLAVIGIGMGFTMGTPLNYMILENTTPDQSTSAIATVALVRQMGTTIAPALLVSCIAGGGLQGYETMMLLVAAFNVISLVLLVPYKGKTQA